jgi:hypothetical protein
MLLQLHPLKALDFDSVPPAGDFSYRRGVSTDGRSERGCIDGFALSDAAAQVITEGPVGMLSSTTSVHRHATHFKICIFFNLGELGS